jgi:hypothetical protein
VAFKGQLQQILSQPSKVKKVLTHKSVYDESRQHHVKLLTKKVNWWLVNKSEHVIGDGIRVKLKIDIVD